MGEVEVLATGVAFANGVAVVSMDETSVLYTSTFESAVMRHCLGKDGDDDGMNVVVVVVGGGGGGGWGWGPRGCWTAFPASLMGLTAPSIGERATSRSLRQCHRPWYRRERYPDYGASS